ncbi:MAG: MATE family efflux transporter [Bacteroidaceae bacterium]|nr:MATE family efflux transporter [Bacteroidaceae bacterium]
MRPSKDTLLGYIREGRDMSMSDKIRLTAILSAPAMLAQLSYIVMQYIDASMVGSLGAAASASIGIVSTTMWLFGGLCSSVSTGFSVQVAHSIGANDFSGARRILRESIFASLAFSLALMCVGFAISPHLPRWLGGDSAICNDASSYFFMFCLVVPLLQLNGLCSSMLRCSGNMKVPSLVNVAACGLDVLFNWIFIYKVGMGVFGAALGTAVAEAISAFLMMYFLFVRNKGLNIVEKDDEAHRRFLPSATVLRKAFHIGGPLGVEHLIMCGAQIMSTVIVAPLGTVAIAANSFGITIESLCYMPGYGIAEAATTLVGQSLGAKRSPLARSFGWITVWAGIGIMTFMGVVMYLFAPALMTLMSPDVAVQQLASEVLRIESFAEPMFAASIVAYGVFVGSGDTIIPCTMNLTSIWVVRISLAAILASTMGLHGVWVAMAVELCFRGAIFLIRMRGNKWSQVKPI